MLLLRKLIARDGLEDPCAELLVTKQTGNLPRLRPGQLDADVEHRLHLLELRVHAELPGAARHCRPTRRCVFILNEELGLAPGPEPQRAHHRVLTTGLPLIEEPSAAGSGS